MNNATSEDYLREEAHNDIITSQETGTYNGYDVHWEVATGCWIDDRWGVYAVVRLIDIAREYGFEVDDEDDLAVTVYMEGGESFELDGEIHYASEWVMDIADEAEEWLNKNIAKPGYLFGWSDGEFFLMNIEWWSEEG